jgi:MFS family permease
MLFYASFNMIIPELFDYLSGLGGAGYKGLIIALFTLTALISRPFSGKLSDKIGRIPVMVFGAVVCFICGFIYPILSGAIAFFMLRMIHGFSTGFTPTGQTAYLADIIPADRRGEAMGMMGTASSVGMAGGPALGSFIANTWNIDVLFYSSSLFAIASILVLSRVKETVQSKSRISVSMFYIRRQDLLEPRVIMPCLVMGLTAYTYGAIYTLMPDFGAHLGMTNKGELFAYLTLASLITRFLAGRASDKFGRANTLKVSSTLMAVAALVIGYSTTAWQLILGVVLYGFANGTNSPTTLAWTADLSDENHKGRGVASLYIFMELGIGVGAFTSGIVYANNPSRMPVTFIVCSILCATALIYLLMLRKVKPVVL